MATTVIAGCANENESATNQATSTVTAAVGPTGTLPEQQSGHSTTDVDPTLDAGAPSAANENESATNQATSRVTTAAAGPTDTQPEQQSSQSSADVDPALDAAAQSAEVLAAAVRYRVETYASGHYTTLFIIDHVGRYSPEDGYITDWVDGPELTATERDVIATALGPRPVTWISDWRDVMGEPPSPTLPNRHALILLAEPSIDGSRAEVATELSCGTTCSYGATSTLEQSPAGEWVVTGETNAFVS